MATEIEVNIDALMPPEMAARAEAIGIRKAAADFWTMFALSILAGAFIATGAIFSTTMLVGASALPYGVGRLLAGLGFCLGLILVVVASVCRGRVAVPPEVLPCDYQLVVSIREIDA